MPNIAGLGALSEKFGPWPAFHGTDFLELADVNHQNVRFEVATDSLEDRIKVEVHSVFGAGCCQGRVLRIQKSGE